MIIKNKNEILIKEIKKQNDFAHIKFTGNAPAEDLSQKNQDKILKAAAECNDKVMLDCEKVIYKQNLIFEHNLGKYFSELFMYLNAVAFIASKIFIKDKNLPLQLNYHSHLENVCINRGLNFRFFHYNEKDKAKKWLLNT